MPTQTQNLTSEEPQEVDDLSDDLSEADGPESVADEVAEDVQLWLLIGSLTNQQNDDQAKRQLILDLEGVAFDQQQSDALKPEFLRFIESHRDSSDPFDAIAVGSAIRQYVAILDGSELGSVASILEAGHRVPVTLEIELEVAKMVVRKLTAVPCSSANPLPELADRLMEICGTYLNPRLLPRTNYGATALNAVLSLTLLASNHLPELFDRLQKLPVAWFKQQVARRAKRMLDEPALQEAFKAGWPCSKCLQELATSVTTENR